MPSFDLVSPNSRKRSESNKRNLSINSSLELSPSSTAPSSKKTFTEVVASSTPTSRQLDLEKKKISNFNGAISNNKDCCRQCSGLVGKKDNGLECESCFFWFHATCEEINTSQYNMIRKLGNKIEWRCKECKTNKQDIIIKLEEDIANANERIKILKQQIETNNIEIDKSGMTNSVIDKLSNKCNDIIREMESKILVKFDDMKKI